jgi:hypothetical protein
MPDELLNLYLKSVFFFLKVWQWPCTMLSAATFSLEHLSYSHNKSLWYQQHVVTVIWHNLQPPFKNKVTAVTWKKCVCVCVCVCLCVYEYILTLLRGNSPSPTWQPQIPCVCTLFNTNMADLWSKLNIWEIFLKWLCKNYRILQMRICYVTLNHYCT